jgi:hypothetical protein
MKTYKGKVRDFCALTAHLRKHHMLDSWSAVQAIAAPILNMKDDEVATIEISAPSSIRVIDVGIEEIKNAGKPISILAEDEKTKFPKQTLLRFKKMQALIRETQDIYESLPQGVKDHLNDTTKFSLGLTYSLSYDQQVLTDVAEELEKGTLRLPECEERLDRSKLVHLTSVEQGRELRNEIRGSLLTTLHEHGPIKTDNVESAVKRVLGAIKNYNKRHRAQWLAAILRKHNIEADSQLAEDLSYL